MPKRASSEPFNPHTRYHIIPRLNAPTASPVDIAGYSRGLQDYVSRKSVCTCVATSLTSLDSLQDSPFVRIVQTVSDIDMEEESEQDGSSSVLSAQQRWVKRSIALALLHGELLNVQEVIIIGRMLLNGIILGNNDDRFLWCVIAIERHQKRSGIYSSPRDLVAWAINELSLHLHLSGIFPGSKDDIGQAPCHPDDPYRSHYKKTLASIEEEMS